MSPVKRCSSIGTVFFTLVPRQRVERELFWVSGTEARRLRFRALRQALLNPRAPRLLPGGAVRKPRTSRFLPHAPSVPPVEWGNTGRDPRASAGLRAGAKQGEGAGNCGGHKHNDGF